MKYIVFLILFLLILPPPTADAQSRRLRRADQAFEYRHYSEALELYRQVFRRVNRDNRSEGVRILFRQGVCNMYLNEPRRAETFFRRAVRGNYPDPVVHYYYARALMQNQKFDEALAQFTIFAEKAPGDWRGQMGIRSIEVARRLIESPGLYLVEMAPAFNSRADEFAPAFGDHRNSVVIFTSSRESTLDKDIDPWTGKNFTSLFISFQDRMGEWSAPVLLDEGVVNTGFNEGAPSVNDNGTQLYFTRCYQVPNVDMGCRIFHSQRQGANWGQPTEVQLVTDSTVSVGHPAISPDEMRLYFVSDMPGGYGGNDIWYVERRSIGGPFRTPVNAGAVINTPGDEMFPYIREDGTLFFSSNGHPGLGGLDIFYAEADGLSWHNPTNMGTPVNSSGDDFGIVFRKGENSGFFSSNRTERGVHGDAIFSFALAPVEFTLRGTVRDDSTKQVLPDAQIQLIGSDGSFATAHTDINGVFLFDKEDIRQNTSYQILVSKEQYFNERGHETTLGIARSRDFVFDFYLVPIPYTPIELPEILYDFASYELLPQYQDSLIGLIQTLQENPNLRIELASHTDSRGTQAFNDTLSLRRAQSVVNYLVQRGIEQGRMVAAGYGSRVPRTIERTIVRDGFTFTAGTVLNDAYINSLPTERHRDAAHQLNRRTEFRVMDDDYGGD